jgi:hypothetical protein
MGTSAKSRSTARPMYSTPTVHVWSGAKLTLIGWYQTHFEIDRREIGRLFHLAYGHRELDDIVRLIGLVQG